MENTSKALLIVAAILLALLIVGLGMMIFNSSFERIDGTSSTLESSNISTFNSQFSYYLSNSATGTQAKSLVDKILKHNATVTSSSPSYSAGKHHVYLNFYPPNGQKKIVHKWKTNDLKNIQSRILSGTKYKIYITSCTQHSGGYYNGYIACISIRALS